MKNANARKTNIAKKIDGDKKLCEKYGHEKTQLFAQFRKDECLTYLQYKKHSKNDSGLPKDLQECRACCIKWMTCPFPTASPTASDDKGGDGMQDRATEEDMEDEAQWNVMDCVEGLMEFVTQAGGKTIQMCGIWSTMK